MQKRLIFSPSLFLALALTGGAAARSASAPTNYGQIFDRGNNYSMVVESPRTFESANEIGQHSSVYDSALGYSSDDVH